MLALYAHRVDEFEFIVEQQGPYGWSAQVIGAPHAAFGETQILAKSKAIYLAEAYAS